MGLRELGEFLGRIRGATLFEESAGHTLDVMLGHAAAALAASPWSATGKLTRAMVHVRPSDGYRQLIVLEHGSKRAMAPQPSSTRLPSMTAWRMVAQLGCGVAIDVNFGRLEPQAAGVQSRLTSGFRVDSGARSTRERLIERGTTHVYVVPMRGARGDVEGMISLEAECQACIGLPFIWSECGPQLQMLADLATPSLMALPSHLGAGDAEEHDPLLPVQGTAMKSLVRLLAVFARQDETILLSGATGTGKSRLARWCHARSQSRGEPFEVLDLSAVPEELQLAELFGWRKGAFTGAVRDHVGAVERAGNGTLFIDEIDKLSLRAQAGLLQLLEARTYRALGEVGGERRSRARFIVGTNVNLQAAVRAQRLREDLYYRINVLPIRLPSLSERVDEIPLWAHYMVERRHGERANGLVVELAPSAIARLVAYSWPGNLRQLDNVIRRAYSVALAETAAAPVLRIDELHVALALAYEQAEPDRSLLDLLHAAAMGFVREAERRAPTGVPLMLELTDAFQGLVLMAATEKLQSRDDAFRLFGKEAQVRSRNQHKVLRRAAERVEALRDALGVETAAPTVRLDADRYAR